MPDNETSKKLNIYIDTADNFRNIAEYVFRFFCDCLQFTPAFIQDFSVENIHIYYGEKPHPNATINICHNPTVAVFYQQAVAYEHTDITYAFYEGTRLPFLFSPAEKPVISAGAITKDIVASAFYFLSCWSEYAAADEAYEGYRFDYRKSLQYKGGFAETPVVDFYSLILHDCLGLKGINSDFKKASPEVSHDIDYFDFWTKKQLLDTYIYNLKRLFKSPISAGYKLFGHFFTKQFFHHPKKDLVSLYKKEQALNVQSISFLMVREDNDSKQGYMENDDTLAALHSIYAGKHIGLHGSRAAAFDENALQMEYKRLKAKGFHTASYRNHYLCFDYQKTFAILEKAGFKTDSTLGYWEHIGFRAGTGRPFQPYNIAEDRPFQITEKPLIIMDATLMMPNAMNMGYKEAKRRVFELIKNTQKTKSAVNILWHNNRFDRIDYPWLGKLFWEILNIYVKKDI
ncbi:MAG: hypothetical protein FWG20_06565 [Candidatus Cloacimonetes bacterium]|nr:hypothetical protein [Candidatus Cloacimonadota bacterium]